MSLTDITDTTVGVTVPINPMLPTEDQERRFVWQAVVVGNNSETANKTLMELEAKGYEFTCRAPEPHGCQLGMVLVYRKERDLDRKPQVELIDTLVHQVKMVDLKCKVDELTVKFKKFREDNPGPGWN